MIKNKTGLVIGILLALVLILGALVFYSYIVKSYVSNYSGKFYNQGASDALTILVGQIQTRGYAEIPLGNGQSLILVPVQQTSSQEETVENSSG